LCASISPRPEVLRSVPSLFWLSTVIACPPTRALASVARKSSPGTTPLMRHSSIASDVVPVRSPSARKPCEDLRVEPRQLQHAESARGPAGRAGFWPYNALAIMSEPKPSYHDNPTEPKLQAAVGLLRLPTSTYSGRRRSFPSPKDAPTYRPTRRRRC
jgi:hypothetical protein